MPLLDPIAVTTENTVVAEYEPMVVRYTNYQSEAELEAELIRMLKEQGYEYLSIHSEAELIDNLRQKLSELNHYQFTDTEWNQFFTNVIASQNSGIVEKTRMIQEDYIQTLKRDDGSTQNIRLLDKDQIHNNRLQVINQYAVSKDEGAKHDNRYDVTILMNGLPVVHIELKRRGVDLREAFNQIDRYQRDSFWAASGLFEYVQIFVISNGTLTKYYSNTTRWNVEKENEGGRTERTSCSFEFTSYWADAKNRPIPDLIDFTKTFFAKHTLLNILTKYCVFTVENNLLVMRPYQITAVEKIVQQVMVSTNQKTWGSLGRVSGGGFVWHTTGSGKTLTSFKTARLLSRSDYIDKVLFVVDRKDLDYQTMKEYDRFEKGAANSNSSTAVLARQLSDPKAKIIITTIQKLSNFIHRNKSHAVYDQHVVIIFDECHRSQFGDMHDDIKKAFRKYHMFGFTGTPIFAVNAVSCKDPQFATTSQRFGGMEQNEMGEWKPLHTYTIVDAIRDGNVLPFRIDYLKTMDMASGVKDEQVWSIDRERALMAPQRINQVTSYILEHFDQKTYRGNKTYQMQVIGNIGEVARAQRGRVEESRSLQRISGFNSIFAVSSIDAAKLYYAEFKRQMNEDPSKKLRVALIYSYGANDDAKDGVMNEENSEDTSALNKNDRDFLEDAIQDYNEMFGTKYSTDGDTFQNYYRDVSLRMKNKELDLLIVVSMFLTGFDATTLNTLWVDKNLRMHGLIQAFSRTNRILNSVKSFGNIVCFRNLQEQVDEAIAQFGNKDAGGIVLMKCYDDYYEGYDTENGKHVPGFVDIVDALQEKFDLADAMPETDEEKREFVRLFGSFLRLRNILSSFDEFEGQDLVSDRNRQDYMSWYLEIRNYFKDKMKHDPAYINDDLVFEVELIKQIEVTIDYVLTLVAKYKDSQYDKEIVGAIMSAVNSSAEMRPKKPLIEAFLAVVSGFNDVTEGWYEFVKAQKEVALDEIIQSEKLKPEETRKFIEDSFESGMIKTVGTDIDTLLPPISRFGGGNRAKKKETVIEKLRNFFDMFSGVS